MERFTSWLFEGSLKECMLQRLDRCLSSKEIFRTNSGGLCPCSWACWAHEVNVSSFTLLGVEPCRFQMFQVFHGRGGTWSSPSLVEGPGPHAVEVGWHRALAGQEHEPRCQGKGGDPDGSNIRGPMDPERAVFLALVEPRRCIYNINIYIYINIYTTNPIQPSIPPIILHHFDRFAQVKMFCSPENIKGLCAKFADFALLGWLELCLPPYQHLRPWPRDPEPNWLMYILMWFIWLPILLNNCM